VKFTQFNPVMINHNSCLQKLLLKIVVLLL